MWDNIRWTIEDLGFTNILVVVLMGIIEVSFLIGIGVLVVKSLGAP